MNLQGRDERMLAADEWAELKVLLAIFDEDVVASGSPTVGGFYSAAQIERLQAAARTVAEKRVPRA